MLALRPGTPVSADAIIDQLWAGEPPDGAATTLRSYVSRLRSALGDAAAIERVAAGYVLDVPEHAVDVVRFEALVREGRGLLERLRHRRAAEVLRQALVLWRGQPFAGIPEASSLAGEVVRLEELRLHAVDSRFEAELDLGRAPELVDELEALVAAHPFRERLWRHLMLALYRAGRQADALAAYHRARAALDEELGIEPGDELRELEAAILRQDVPPAPVAREPSVGLPSPLTSFIGRAAELEDVRGLLRRARLVTLVGVGGVGKTRLAIEAARHAVDEVADSVAFVDLAAVQDPAHIPSHVAQAVGLPDDPGRDLAASLQERDGGSALLIVLDNCEHVREATASLARSLLESTADMRVLATSREVLDIPGEASYPVPPLEVPAAVEEDDAPHSSEAVRLLIDRATLVRHDLRVDDATWRTAARICRDLEGLPLAIELAAARAKALSLDEIAERIQDRFRFLVSWRRLTAARHRTLAEAMDWSYELLATDEQALLTRLSVFPAGAKLESVAEVCLLGDDAEAERLLERLVDASLVVPIDTESGTRYRLLETVRQYAAGRLADEELEGLRRRHAERVRSIAVSTHLSLEGTGQPMSFQLAREEMPSIRLAIRWAVAADPTLGLEIACALERMWVSSHAREGITTFTELLERDGIPERHRARALRCRGGCRYVLGEFAASTSDYEAAIALHRRLGDAPYVGHLLTRLAVEAERLGDVKRTRELLQEAASVTGEPFAPNTYVVTGLMASLALRDGRIEEGLELLRREGELAGAAGDRWWQLNAEIRLAERALQLGRLDEGGDAARRALELSFETGGRADKIFAIGFLALEAAARGQARRAGRLWGGLEAELDRGGPVGQWEDGAEELRALVAARAGATFETEVAQARGLPLDAVTEEALSRA